MNITFFYSKCVLVFIINWREMKSDIKKVETIAKFFIKKLNENAVIPKKGSSGAAGYDICSS